MDRQTDAQRRGCIVTQIQVNVQKVSCTCKLHVRFEGRVSHFGADTDEGRPAGVREVFSSSWSDGGAVTKRPLSGGRKPWAAGAGAEQTRGAVDRQLAPQH